MNLFWWEEQSCCCYNYTCIQYKHMSSQFVYVLYIKSLLFLAEDVNSMGVRLRLYGCERMRRERMIGETVVSFSCVNLELEANMWLSLEPRANLAVSYYL